MILDELFPTDIDDQLDEGVIEDMLGDFADAPKIKQELNHIIKYANDVLVKKDRKVWFSRLIKLYFAFHYKKDDFQEVLDAYNNKTKGTKLPYAAATKIADPRIMLRNLDHYLSLNVPKITNLVFGWQTYPEIIDEFVEIEQDWMDKTRNLIPNDPDLKKILTMDGGKFVWFDLERNYCREEGDAMGHCGNASGNSGQTIFSLREKQLVGQETFWRPAATFIYNKNEKTLGEMKGRGNEKPAPKYHEYILELLEHPNLIAGIVSGGYKPENNFAMGDLPEAKQKELYQKNPKLFTLRDVIGLFGKNVSQLKEIFSEAGLRYADGFVFHTIDSSNQVLSGKDIIENVGDRASKWILRVMEGDEFLDDYHVNLEDYIDGDNKKSLEQYLAQKYPEEDGSFKGLLSMAKDDDDPVVEELDILARDSWTSGTEDEMISSLESAFSELKKSVAENTDLVPVKIDNLDDDHLLNRNWVWGANLEQLMDADDWVITTSDVSDAIERSVSREELLKVDEPRYGWDGFDEEHFNSEFSRIMKDALNESEVRPTNFIDELLT